MKKIQFIDFLKGYSILTIILMHLIQNYMELPSLINKASSFGGAGVHIFIFCSGFGLFYSYLSKKLTFTEFLKKRFSKIYFPYIFIILISAFIPFMYTQSDKLTAVFSHIFLFKMFFNNYECSFGCHFWFISTIIQFYLIFNLLVMLKNKINNDKKFILINLCISISWWIITGLMGNSEIRIWNSFFLQYLWEFSLGMVLASKIHANKGIYTLPKSSIIFVASIIGLALYGILGFKGGFLKLFNDIPSLLSYGGIALLIYKLNINILNKFILKINTFSYELYLVHILVFSCVFNLFNLNKIMAALISLLLALISAKLFHLIILEFNNYKLTFYTNKRGCKKSY